MKTMLIVILLFLSGSVIAQQEPAEIDSMQQTTDSVMAVPLKKHPWLAAAGVVGLNTGVQLYNRFLKKEDFAQTTMRTTVNNFKRGMVWDNDIFIMNMFAHPYHGNLYFNVARSNGLNFWESVPYVLGGSLMWEFFGEKDPPAINDVIATTIGGVAIGEIAHRVSDVVLDDRERGFRRFLREAAAFVINPMKGIGRILRGDAWRVRNRIINIMTRTNCLSLFPCRREHAI